MIAIIISNNIIKATRDILPINSDIKISSKLSLRLRAAVSIKKTDAIAIVVSEETGKISYLKRKFINLALKMKL